MLTSSSAPASARSVAGGPGCHMSSQTVGPIERLAVLEQNQVTTGCEVPVLVEDAVVRQEALAVHRLDLAGGADVARVVEIAVEVRRADEDGRAARLARDLLDRFLRGTDEAGPEQEVLRRIAGDGQLREDDEVGGVALRLGEPLEDQLAVALEIADDRVDLGQCEPHAAQSSCLRLSVENYSAAPAELHDPERNAVPAEHVAASRTRSRGRASVRAEEVLAMGR